ncbi:UBN2_3 domain-containing protein [Cucumis melo var. makuwa]|uniref:UBN2_3 domain-containing protein n=1 Tax=Cucumis melo var. makuwa TaxID=1194695 RepID=A0A5D3BF31_CUCMM|nr:UBN2_3 domain-containing protein [Cucumis melo var. makuwa]
MEKLLQNLQKPSIYLTGVVPQPYALSSDQKMIHAPLVSQPLFSGNGIDQPQNRSDIEAGESSMHSKPTELPMYSNNPITSFPNLQSNYITGSLRNFSETVRPSPRDALERLWKGEDSLIRSMLINSMEPQIGKPLLYAATAKDLWDTTQTLYLK